MVTKGYVMAGHWTSLTRKLFKLSCWAFGNFCLALGAVGALTGLLGGLDSLDRYPVVDFPGEILVNMGYFEFPRLLNLTDTCP